MTILKAGAVHFAITLVFYMLVKGSLGLSFTGMEVSSPIANIAVPIWQFLMSPLAWLESVQFLMEASGRRGRGILMVMITNSAIWGLGIAAILRGVEHIKDRRYAAR